MAEPGSRSSRPLQGIMLLVLLLLASTKAAVPAMASVEQGVELLDAAVSGISKTAKKEWKKPAKVFNRAYKGGKALGDKQKEDEQQYPGGGVVTTTMTYVVDTVVVDIPAAGTSFPRLPVATADITATAAVRKASCGAPGVLGVPRNSSITLLGRGGRQLGVLPAGTLLDCSSGRAADALAVLGLGRGGQLSTRFPKFSYTVREDLTVAVVLLSPSAPPQVVGRGHATIPLFNNLMYPSLYYVKISAILFGSQPIRMEEMQLSLSTTETYTYLESGAYGQFKKALMSKIQELYPMVRTARPLRFPADELCYVRNDLTARLPPFTMTILFAGGNAGMELTSDKVWYEPEQGSPTVCMAILPAALSPGGVPILGTRLQNGRTMTVDLTSAQGTLTF